MFSETMCQLPHSHILLMTFIINSISASSYELYFDCIDFVRLLGALIVNRPVVHDVCDNIVFGIIETDWFYEWLSVDMCTGPLAHLFGGETIEITAASAINKLFAFACIDVMIPAGNVCTAASCTGAWWQIASVYPHID